MNRAVRVLLNLAVALTIVAGASLSSAAQISISLSPKFGCLLTGQQQQFTATVTGATNTGVKWQVDNVNGGYAAGGWVSSTGLYTAPSTAGTHYVKVVSQANSGYSTSTQVNVVTAPSVSVLPTSATVLAGGTQQFNPTVCGWPNATVAYSVDGVANGNATIGTVSSSGVYQAPATAGSHKLTITATNGTNTKTTSATINVYTQVSADFSSRTSTQYPVPAGMFGAQLGYTQNNFYTDSASMQTLAQAGLNELRVDAGLQNIFFSSSTPDWTQIDPILTGIQSAGMHPLIVVAYTPAWLQPASTPCGAGVQPYHAPPTNLQAWVQLATQLVQHIDLNFPGLVQNYEIWNEPDQAAGLCTSPSTDAQRRSTYLSMYAAVAPALMAEANADSAAFRVGGPALTNAGNAANWIPALLSNASTGPYVQFVSYHQYPGYPSATNAGMLWDNTVGSQSMSSRTQDPSIGFFAVFRYITNLTRQNTPAGRPVPPLILDEYNTTAAFAWDCCRNSPSYAPLFNAMALQDVLSGVYGGYGTPLRVDYFAAQDWFPTSTSGTFWFCLLGSVNSAMDCSYNAAGPTQPYPQYYAFSLLGAAGNLGLASGGYMAPSVSPPITQAGLVVSAFYTAASDGLAITNPSSTDYTNLTVNLQNPGSVLSSGTYFLLNSTNPKITVQPLSLTPSGNGFTATINVPRYSVVGLSLTSTSAISVTIAPASATVPVNLTQAFSATVSNTRFTGVNWFVDGIQGGNSTVGTVSANGVYTAPAATGTHVVTAQSIADPSKTSNAVTVTVSSGISVAVSPQSVSIPSPLTQQFQANITGSSNGGVTWTVDGIAGGNTAVGTISASGLYSSPIVNSGTQKHTIAATSVQDPTKNGSANVTVGAPIIVAIMPNSAALVSPNGTQQFSATVTNSTSSNAVSWLVDNVAGGNATVGTIDGTGFYTAPASAGLHVVKARSVQDTNKFAAANITVFNQVTADFGSRQNTAYPVPTGILGAALGTYSDNLYLNSTALAQLAEAGVTQLRVDALLQNVFSTSASTPNWTYIDPIISAFQTAGIRPMIMMGYTPYWLQPSPNPCSVSGAAIYHSVPANISTWAQLTAQFVAHVDQKYPNFVKDYEVWNEPDLAGGLCVPSGSSAMNTYIQMYSAAAAAMQTQAQLDGATINIGGPVLGNANGTYPTWIPALLADPNAAPYVNFVSYHHYQSSAFAINNGMNWDSSTAQTPLYQRTQDPQYGAAALYSNIAGLVAKGSQPNAKSTPVFVTEFNTSSAFQPDCCRNDYVYGPIWNGLFMADMLSSVYPGAAVGPAAAVPSRLLYYGASIPSGPFCLIGVVDTNMDCAYSSSTASTAAPYPQYYAYQLLAGPAFLNLGNGGYLANSVSPPITQGGLAPLAFYTPGNDAIYIVNPTTTDYANLTVVAQNPGFSTVQSANSYLISATSTFPGIASQSLTVTPVTNGYSVTVNVPHYSVVAVSIAGQ